MWARRPVLVRQEYKTDLYTHIKEISLTQFNHFDSLLVKNILLQIHRDILCANKFGSLNSLKFINTVVQMHEISSVFVSLSKQMILFYDTARLCNIK